MTELMPLNTGSCERIFLKPAVDEYLGLWPVAVMIIFIPALTQCVFIEIIGVPDCYGIDGKIVFRAPIPDTII